MTNHEEHSMATPDLSTPRRPGGWNHHHVLGLIGVLTVTVVALLLLVGAVLVNALDGSRRHDALSSDEVSLHTTGYALTSTSLDLEGLPSSWLVGDAQLRITPMTDSVFAGIARPSAAAEYLRGVSRSTVTEVGEHAVAYAADAGHAPRAAPRELDIWVAQGQGRVPITLTWPDKGRWTLVVMNSDGSRAVDVEAAVQVEAPHLHLIVVASAVVGFALLGAAGALLVVVIRRIRGVRGRLHGTPPN
jgi:hypothetical protein